MRKYLYILAGALLSSCSGSPTDLPELARKESANRIDVYYGVNDLETDKPADLEQIRQAGFRISAEPNQMVVVHFLDTTAFTIPGNGEMYGGAAIRKKVVAQYTRLPGQPEGELEVDPFATGLYKQPNL